jgi:hypothetical protein
MKYEHFVVACLIRNVDQKRGPPEDKLKQTTALSSIIWLTMLSSRIWGSHSGSYEEFHLLGYNAV